MKEFCSVLLRIPVALPAAATALGLAVVLGFLASPPAHGGAFIVAEVVADTDAILHPTGYSGSGGVLAVSVCIDPASPNLTDMEIPLENIISVYNALTPTTPNLVFGGSNNIPSSAIDWESVALHEVGHCLGMNHPNLATESGLTGDDQNYTKALKGSDDEFDVGEGTDMVIGSADDVRGDDVNLHWFRTSNNNPFTIAGTVDSTTYSVDLGDLPGSDLFAANGDRDVATLLVAGSTEVVMQQGTFVDEAQRTLAHDDVATLSYGMSGVDELAGTGDDYTFTLSFAGSTDSCDIVVAFDNAETGFAVCKTSFSTVLVSPFDHWAITSANVFFNTGFTWFFNDELLDCGIDSILTLMNDTVSTTETFEACHTIKAGTDFVVSATGDATFRAGSRIILEDGFSVEGDFTAEIDPALK
jgi:hypothetical protein